MPTKRARKPSVTRSLVDVIYDLGFGRPYQGRIAVMWISTLACTSPKWSLLTAHGNKVIRDIMGHQSLDDLIYIQKQHDLLPQGEKENRSSCALTGTTGTLMQARARATATGAMSGRRDG